MSARYDISPARYRIKKIARRLAVGMGRAIATAGTGDPSAIRVLTYHRFGDRPLDACCLARAEFSAQLDWLAGHCNVLSPQEFDSVMSGRSPVRPRSVLITIDDGHQSIRDIALPQLDARGMKAVLFVCPGLILPAGAGPQPAAGQFMTWEDLACAGANGHEIAGHGYSHQSLGRLPLAQAIEEIDNCRRALADRLGSRSASFSFPFGTRADYSAPLLDALDRRGVRYRFSSVHGHCVPGTNPTILPRIKIEGGGETDLFPDIVRGCMDHWRFVDKSLYLLLQQRGRL